MKNLKQLFTIIFILIIGACAKEDQNFNLDTNSDEVYVNSQDKGNKEPYDKANCSKNCPVGECEASGTTVTCKCVLGLFAKCVSSGSTMAPTQDSGQQNEAGNLSSFILNNIEPTTVANSLSTTVNNIQTAIETENTIEYENGLIDFENQMNDLSTSNKEAMNNYAESIDIEPIFNL